MEAEIIDRESARSKGLVSYFTGVPCKNGHINKRYTNTGICYSCKRDQINRDYTSHKTRVIETNNRSRKRYPEKINALSRKWVKNNHERRLSIMAKYRENNRDEINKYGKAYIKRKRLDPYYRISKNLSKALWDNLKTHGKKKGARWISLVNFTIEELIYHLESQFRDGMTWDNYGPFWHVDHIRPLSSFSSEKLMDAWELSNLQPLLKQENLSKSSKIIQ